MKSQIKTIDALLAEEKSYPISTIQLEEPVGIEIAVLGFKNIQHREKVPRPISKIMNPSTLKND